MESRIRDVETRPLRRYSGLERRRVRSGGRIGDPDDLDLMRAQKRLKVEVAWIVDQNRIAGPQQEAADQVDRLRPRPVNMTWSGSALMPSSAKRPNRSRRKVSDPRVPP